MCGIVGVLIPEMSDDGMIVDDVLSALQRLEYRGYDSCGFATSDGVVYKSVGKISEFKQRRIDNHFLAAI